MKNYIFRTTATMKPYNNKKWWINSGIVTEKRIEAETVTDALEQWRELVQDRHYITISDSAIKNKSEMYTNTDAGNGLNSILIYGLRF